MLKFLAKIVLGKKMFDNSLNNPAVFQAVRFIKNQFVNKPLEVEFEDLEGFYYTYTYPVIRFKSGGLVYEAHTPSLCMFPMVSLVEMKALGF